MSKPYIHGIKNNACCSLIEHLGEIGVSAAVAHNNRRGKNVRLTAYVESEEDKKNVPAEWSGFPVEAKLRSEIECG